MNVLKELADKLRAFDEAVNERNRKAGVLVCLTDDDYLERAKEILAFLPSQAGQALPLVEPPFNLSQEQRIGYVCGRADQCSADQLIYNRDIAALKEQYDILNEANKRAVQAVTDLKVQLSASQQEVEHLNNKIPITRKDFLSLPVETRQKYLKESVRYLADVAADSDNKEQMKRWTD